MPSMVADTLERWKEDQEFKVISSHSELETSLRYLRPYL